MNGISVYIYKENGKQWYDFNGNSTIEYNYYPLFLYQKYLLNWEFVGKNESSLHSLLLKSEFQQNLKWYEKICLRLSVNGFYISKQSQSIVLEALNKVEEEYPTSTANFPSFCRSMIDILSSYKLKHNEYISVGNFAKGFVKMDSDLISEKESAADIINVAKYIFSKHNVHPFYLGKDVCFDFMD